MNEETDYNKPALLVAISAGDMNTVQALLREGADPNESDQNFRNGAHLAVKLDDVDILRVVCDHGVDLASRDITGNTPLGLAAEIGHLKTLEELMRRAVVQEGEVEEALFQAAFSGHLEIVRTLLRKGADLHHKNDIGRTALFVAAEGGRSDVVSFLLQKGADPGVADELRRTLLHAAAQGNNCSVIQQVLHRGMDVNARDIQGNTPLHFTRCSAVAALLLEKGADINAKNYESATPLLIAARFNNLPLLQYFRERGACEVSYQIRRLKLGR